MGGSGQEWEGVVFILRSGKDWDEVGNDCEGLEGGVRRFTHEKNQAYLGAISRFGREILEIRKLG